MPANTIVKAACFAFVIGASLLLAGCGASRETRAAEACVKAMAERIGDSPYKADVAKIAATAKSESSDILSIESEATTDADQANEKTQLFTCRVQFDPAKPDAAPSVVLFQFNF